MFSGRALRDRVSTWTARKLFALGRLSPAQTGAVTRVKTPVPRNTKFVRKKKKKLHGRYLPIS